MADEEPRIGTRVTSADRTAVRDTGRATALRIIEAARDILQEDGVREFSMRGIAKRAGVRLANVQYYFPSSGDIVRGVMELVAQGYRRAYAELVDENTGDARKQFEAVIRFNLVDIVQPSTRRLFIHLWPLLESEGQFSGKLLLELYSVQFQLLSERIQNMHARVPADEARRRAELIAALIEGLFITLPPTAESKVDIGNLQDRAVRLSFAIADGEF